jgi:hypothetical protein
MRVYSDDELSKILSKVNDPQYNAVRLRLKIQPAPEDGGLKPLISGTEPERGNAELGSDSQ